MHEQEQLHRLLVDASAYGQAVTEPHKSMVDLRCTTMYAGDTGNVWDQSCTSAVFYSWRQVQPGRMMEVVREGWSLVAAGAESGDDGRSLVVAARPALSSQLIASTIFLRLITVPDHARLLDCCEYTRTHMMWPCRY